METIALIIFILTYTGIIFTRLPWINIDRPSAAFFGAISMVLFGVLSFEEAINAIDFNTISLLLGMMILIAVLELDGFFTFIAKRTISISKNKTQLLTIIVFVTGTSSAFLVNDAVVLLFTPVVIEICRSGKLNPIPYLIAEIMASNIGSAMTITGNPQNILIGINSNIAYGKFLIYLAPVSLIGMVLLIFVIKFFFRNEFKSQDTIGFSKNNLNYDFTSMKFFISPSSLSSSWYSGFWGLNSKLLR